MLTTDDGHQKTTKRFLRTLCPGELKMTAGARKGIGGVLVFIRNAISDPVDIDRVPFNNINIMILHLQTNATLFKEIILNFAYVALEKSTICSNNEANGFEILLCYFIIFNLCYLMHR